jgi:hypothetical protein
MWYGVSEAVRLSQTHVPPTVEMTFCGKRAAVRRAKHNR